MYDFGYDTYNTYTPQVSSGVAAIVWGILAIVFAIIGGLLVYFLFLKSKKDLKLNNFLSWLKDFLDFKVMIIEPLLKVLYLISTIYVILVSFSLISASFIAFLLVLVFGPIGVRLVYEGILMAIMNWKNLNELNKKVKEK